MKAIVSASSFTAFVFVIASIVAEQDRAVPWWSGYSGKEANGPDVLGFWRFDGEGDGFVKDESSQTVDARIAPENNYQQRHPRTIEMKARNVVSVLAINEDALRRSIDENAACQALRPPPQTCRV